MFLQHLIPRKGTQLGWAGVRWMRVGWAGSRVLGFVWGVFFWGGGAGHRGLDKRRVFRAGVVGTNQLNRAAAKSYRIKLALINKPQKYWTLQDTIPMGV